MQKIVVISFDHWNYDRHIVNELNKLGHKAHHIKIGQFKYKSSFLKIKNFCSKLFLNKNLKHKWRQEFIIDELNRLGQQDQILVINPELIDLECHLLIKNFSKKYIAYLYDSIARCPVEHLLNGIFDEVFSFDKNDVSKYKLQETSNYIYFDKNEIFKSEINQDFIYIGSIDNRLELVNKIGGQLLNENLSFKFYIIGKKAWKYKIFQIFGKYKNLIFKTNRFSQKQTLQLYNQSYVILDIVRPNQTGISFRIFEAMELEKKIITTNINAIEFNRQNQIYLLNNISSFKSILNDEILIYDNSIFKLKNWLKIVFNI